MFSRLADRMARCSLILLVAFAATGCYHAVVETGLPQSGTRIEKPWAHGFVAGLVPPDVIETAQRCPDGVARVETQQTFMNSLVAILTSGIYTPMRIDVFCAAPRDDELDQLVRVDSSGRVEGPRSAPRAEGFYVEVRTDGARGGG